MIIGANILCWIFVQGAGVERAFAESVCRYGVISADLTHTFMTWTNYVPGYCPIDGNPNWFTLISHMFMHGGWFHIIMNMWVLFVFGDEVESHLGHIRFVLFYLLCGLAAAAMEVSAAPNTGIPMVGASGAIGGILGAYVFLHPKAKVVFWLIIPITLSAWVAIGGWLVLQLFGVAGSQGSTGGIAYWAHIGGFVAGLLLITLLNRKRLREVKVMRNIRRRE